MIAEAFWFDCKTRFNECKSKPKFALSIINSAINVRFRDGIELKSIFINYEIYSNKSMHFISFLFYFILFRQDGQKYICSNDYCLKVGRSG